MYIFVKKKLQHKKTYDELYNNDKTGKTFNDWFDERFIYETGKGIFKNSPTVLR